MWVSDVFVAAAIAKYDIELKDIIVYVDKTTEFKQAGE